MSTFRESLEQYVALRRAFGTKYREPARTLGYFAKNNGGGGLKFFADLQEAQSYEHEGDTARTVGKVAVGVLLVAALVALAAGAAASEANANRVTTTCSSFGNSTTCTSR